MSRCVLDNGPYQVVIGWDPGLDTFFAQVIELYEDEPKIWLGTTDYEFPTPDPLFDVIAPYAIHFDRDVLRKSLLADKKTNDQRTYGVMGDKVLA